jgi:hypothetical protein
MDSLRSVLTRSQRQGAALGHFNVADLVLLKAVVAAAVDVRVPVIAGASEGERDFLGTYELAALVRVMRGEHDISTDTPRNAFINRAVSNHPALLSIQTTSRKDDMPEATWKPNEKHGQLTTQSDLPDSVYAFPRQRKEPLTDAQHVRNAVARFDQVIDVSDDDRALAFANIEKAAKYYDVNLAETSWHDLGVHPQKSRKRM